MAQSYRSKTSVQSWMNPQDLSWFSDRIVRTLFVVLLTRLNEMKCYKPENKQLTHRFQLHWRMDTMISLLAHVRIIAALNFSTSLKAIHMLSVRAIASTINIYSDFEAMERSIHLIWNGYILQCQNMSKSFLSVEDCPLNHNLGFNYLLGLGLQS